ncbi:MAG: hydroxymethylglutaryl-CoA lyase [Porticoccaceae bacterium]|nr:hydroxymethylglutaryl-CoA lyase [Porticoccaceae bacterium]|tara:strand:+ start:2691 stop:3608 length:918 start_codon:yes stop_codon:yes gene_type:complete
MKENIVITDVGPRDGLQNQPKTLSIEQRVELIRAIAAAGVPQIEVGSFVSPKAVPAMAGTDRVFAALDAQPDFKTPSIALIPNLKGYELARDAGAKTVTMVLYASNGMAQKNAAMSMTDAEDVTMKILRLAKQDGIEVIATIAVAFACPFDGPSDPLLVQTIASKFIEAGADQLVLADTIGSADPQQVRVLTDVLVKSHGASQLGCHFHDTRAMGLANVYAAVESGVRRFDSSIAGLGGCPFAPGATGNVATDDVAMMLQQMGFETGIDLSKLMEASNLAETLTGTAPGGRSKAWLQGHLAKQAS